MNYSYFFIKRSFGTQFNVNERFLTKIVQKLHYLLINL